MDFDAIGFEARFGDDIDYEAQSDWQRTAYQFTITLTYGDSEAEFGYFMGPATNGQPELASVMDCLCSDARAGGETFEGFCGEFGYDTDSRKAHAIWEGCRATLAAFGDLFGSDLPDVLEHDWDA